MTADRYDLTELTDVRHADAIRRAAGLLFGAACKQIVRWHRGAAAAPARMAQH